VRFQQVEVATQELALARLAEQTKRTMSAPIVRQTVLSILADCPSRDDLCEINAIFNAVKNGDPRVASLARGFKYVADPKHLDYFVSPERNLEWCAQGACGGDCDDHTALICALAGMAGFSVGMRIWGPDPGLNEFSHVYAVVGYPKRGGSGSKIMGMDTTVETSKPGWEPPKGRVKTAWIIPLRG